MFSPLDHHLISLGWHLTPHARQRIHARGVRASDLIAALTRPEITYPTGPGGSRTVLTHGRLAIVAHAKTRNVLTVLLRTEELWDDEDCRAVFAASA